MKGLCDQSLLQMGSFLLNEVAMIAQHVRKGEGKDRGPVIVNRVKVFVSISNSEAISHL